MAGATPYLRLFGLAAGGVYLARGALAAARERRPGPADRARPLLRREPRHRRHRPQGHRGRRRRLHLMLAPEALSA